MRILNIIKETMADGPGLRDSIYTAGCKHHCLGCHNPESWDMRGGTDMSISDILDELNSEFTNITISGGDPFYQPLELFNLLKGIRKRYPSKTIWVYTGYTLQELTTMAKIEPTYNYILSYIDVLVDGPFQLCHRDTSLLYRGSSNQHIYLNMGSQAINSTHNEIIWADITNCPNSY